MANLPFRLREIRQKANINHGPFSWGRLRSAKAEYLYTDLNSGGQNIGYWGFQTGYHNHPKVNVVRAGVNYYCNFGGL